MSSLRGEGQDDIATDPVPAPAAPAAPAVSTSPTGINSINTKTPSAPDTSAAMNPITDDAEASGPSSAGNVPTPAPAISSTPSTAPSAAPAPSLPFDERPLPPTPTAEDVATEQPADATATVATPAAVLAPTRALAPTRRPSTQLRLGTPVSPPAVAEAIHQRVPTPFPVARALPPPPPEESLVVVPSEQPPAPPSPPAIQPPRRVSIASSQSSLQLPSTSSRPPRFAQIEYVVPRWQPDKEVLYCPICFVYFSLFNRKHHCRKCGRVVCNRCSPHRIVIPHAYIVQPPDVLQARAAGNDAGQTPGSSSGGSAAFVTPSSTRLPVLGGGERVRLCNPCVPDPNTSPPSAPGAAGHLRSRSGSSIAGGSSYASYGSRRHGLDIAAASGSASGSASGAGQASASNAGDRRYTVSNTQNPGAGSLPGGRYQYYGSLPPQSTHYHQRPSILQADRNGMSAEHASSSAHQSQHRRQQQPRYQIPEEDECPVCHLELPKRTLPSFETLREQHIEECISLHSQYLMGNTSGGGSGAAAGGRTRATSTATTSSATSAAQPTPSRRSNSHSHNQGNSVSGSDGSPSASSSADSLSSSGPGSAVYSPSSPRAMAVHRHTGIFPYKATAKDCASDAECTICLEDLEVGDAMARLECFCRFHEHCIRAWFVRHPGRCPVHQHGMTD